MRLENFMIDPRRLWPGESPYDGPIAFVDLDAADDVAGPLVPPPCPVIGIGECAHRLAEGLDGVAGRPFGASLIAQQVLANPRAAAVTVQLLRLLPSLCVQDGLVAESLAYAVLQGSAEHARWRESHPRAEPRAAGQVQVRREDDRLTITLASPASGNAIDRAMRDGLHEALSLAALDQTLPRVVLRADGKAFSLGAELAEFGTTSDPATAHEIRTRTLPAWPAMRCADRLEVHVQGACVGAGLELAAWAQRVTATSHAWFQLPELAMGILPGAGGCVSLTRRIGRQRTALLILSGKRLNARQALAWGLVDAIVDDPS